MRGLEGALYISFEDAMHLQKMLTVDDSTSVCIDDFNEETDDVADELTVNDIRSVFTKPSWIIYVQNRFDKWCFNANCAKF